jgi:hypothetical protein
MMKLEVDRKKIREFLEFVENEKYDLRKYSKPALVYFVDDDKRVKYSLWENDDLHRFGLNNVDGWDFEDDLLFCPDWVQEKFEDEEDEDSE